MAARREKDEVVEGEKDGSIGLMDRRHDAASARGDALQGANDGGSSPTIEASRGLVGKEYARVARQL